MSNHTTISLSQKKYISKMQKDKNIITLLRAVIIVIFILVWELSGQFGFIDTFFFSSPLGVLSTFYSMCKDFTIFSHIGVTVLETIISFSLVIIISLFVAMFLWVSKRTSAVLEPYLVVLNSLPKSALAPLLIVWLGTGMTTIIVAGVSVAVFGSIISLYTAFLQVDHDMAKLIYTLGGNKRDVLFKVVLPGSIPTILSIMKVNIGLSLVGVVIGEFLAARQGLGYLIIYSSQVFQLDILIMSILLLCIISMILYYCINQIEKIYLKKLNH